MKEHTNKKVIVIVNMPCSSGTFYTSFISKSLSEDPWIIDETSPNTPNSYGLKAFSVSVPLLKECLRGRVAYQEWEHCYKTQIETIPARESLPARVQHFVSFRFNVISWLPINYNDLGFLHF